MDFESYLEELRRKAEISRLTDVRHLKVPIRIANIFWHKVRQVPFSLVCYPLRHLRLITDKNRDWETLIVLALFSESGWGAVRDYLRVDKVKTEKLPPMIFKLALPNSLKSAIKVLFDPKRRLYEGEALKIVYHGFNRFDVYLMEDVDKFSEFAQMVKDYMGDIAEFKKQLQALPNPVKAEKLVELYEKIFSTELAYYAVAIRQAGEVQEVQEEFVEEQEEEDTDEIEF